MVNIKQRSTKRRFCLNSMAFLLIVVGIILSANAYAAPVAHADALEPTFKQYVELKDKFKEYQAESAKYGNWVVIPQGEVLELGDDDPRVITLRQRLSYPSIKHNGLLRIESPTVFDEALSKQVKEFQRRHGLEADGVVGGETLRALNVPIGMRIAQIAANLARLQTLAHNVGAKLVRKYVMVNIPDFSLSVVDDDKTIFTMPVIVGKRNGLQSCMLNSQITAMDLNPYWYVPQSIAVKYILPILKRNPQFLADNNMQVYTGYGEAGEELNAAKINWLAVTKQNFHYKFRQQPGEGNPLGQIKFIFNNSCGIYMHDTATPELFANLRRDFSHGCIRIAKPLELAAYLVKNDPNWSKDKITTLIDSGKTKRIMLATPMDIYVTYQTAWVDESGVLQWRNDIYSLDTPHSSSSLKISL